MPVVIWKGKTLTTVQAKGNVTRIFPKSPERSDEAALIQDQPTADERNAEVLVQDDYERRLLDRFRHAQEHELEPEPER